MSDNGNSKLIVKQIEDTDDPKAAIGYLAQLFLNMDEKFDTLNKQLVDPDKGVVHRLKKLESNMAIVIWVGGIIGTAIIIAIVENWLTF